MSLKTDRLGGAPGSLKAWLFGLRLPANEHRVLELLVEKADPEDGCVWRGEEWIAHWSAMSVRNVERVIRRLVGRGVLKVWRHGHHRTNTYQVQCPDLPKLDDASRAEILRGVKLSGDNLSGDNLSNRPDKSGENLSNRPDKSGIPDPTSCRPEVPKEVTPVTAEDPQEGTACTERSSAPPDPPTVGIGHVHVHNPECGCHPNPRRPTIQGMPDDSAPVVLVPLVGSEGRPFAITEALLAELGRTYPGVDAPQAARNIRQYALTHPRKRKTPAGIAAHIAYWFGREQNSAGRRAGPPAARRPPSGEPATARAGETVREEVGA